MLSKLEAWLDGRKSYICAITLFGGVVFDFISKGDWSIPSIIAFVKSSALAGGIAALRSAIGGTPAKV